MIGQIARILIQFAGLVVLARLLAPHDYGLMAMMLVIVGISEIFRDFGLTQAAVQAPELTRKQRDNLFWLNTAIGLVLTATVALLAPLIALLFKEPALTEIARWTSLIFLFNGLSTQYRASLNREMRFGSLALIDISASASGLISAVLCAFAGLGYWSLVVQQLVFAIVALGVAVGASRWIPGWINREGQVLGFIRYGISLVGVQLVTILHRSADTFVVSTRLGSTVMGYYDRAFQILLLPLNQINAPATKVALPTLSRLNDQPARFNSFLTTGQSVMVHTLFAVFAFVAAATEPLVVLALGAKWEPSVLILKILCLAGAAQAANYASYWVFLARGLTKQNLQYALVTRPLMVGLIFLGSVWGVHGVAAGYSLGILLAWPAAIAWLTRYTEIPARAMLANGLLAFAIWVPIWAAVSCIDSWMSPHGIVWRLIIDVLAFLVATFLMWLLVPPFRRDIRRFSQLISLIRGRNRD